MIGKNMLDQTSAHGCQIPDCGHQTHELWLHSRCHTDAPFFLMKEPCAKKSQVVHVFCVVPDCPYKVVFKLHVRSERLLGGSRWSRGKKGNRMFEAGCHPDNAEWLAYTHGSGVVQVVCYECRELVAEFVMEDEP